MVSIKTNPSSSSISEIKEDKCNITCNEAGVYEIIASQDGMSKKSQIKIKDTYTIKFIDKEMDRVVFEKDVKINTLFEIDIWKTTGDFLPVDENGAVIGFKIDDGILGVDNIHKEYFSRVITEDTTIECEMLRFDYFFTDNNIHLLSEISEPNLSNLNIGVHDRHTFIYGDTYQGLFTRTHHTHTPNIIFSRNCKDLRSLAGYSNIKWISEKLLYYIPKLETIDYCRSTGTGGSAYKFCNNSKLEHFPDKLFINNRNLTLLEESFAYNKQMTGEITSDTFKNCTNIVKLKDAFKLTSISKIDKDALKYNTKLSDISGMIRSTKIDFIDSNLLGTNPIRKLDFFMAGTLITETPIDFSLEKYNTISNWNGIYSGCEKLVKINHGFIGNYPKSIQYLFSGCNSLDFTNFAYLNNYPSITDVSFMFSYLVYNGKIDVDIFKNLTNVNEAVYMFYMSQIPSIDLNIIKPFKSNLTDLTRMFYGSSVENFLNLDLFDNMSQLNEVNAFMCDCDKYTGKLPELWNEENYPNLRTNGHEYAFKNCKKAINYNDVPYGWKG